VTIEIATLLAPIVMGIAILISQHYQGKRYDIKLDKVSENLSKRMDKLSERIDKLAEELSSVKNLLYQVVSWLQTHTSFKPLYPNQNKNMPNEGAEQKPTPGADPKPLPKKGQK
jgi:hypothetical protein